MLGILGVVGVARLGVVAILIMGVGSGSVQDNQREATESLVLGQLRWMSCMRRVCCVCRMRCVRRMGGVLGMLGLLLKCGIYGYLCDLHELFV